VELGYAFQLFVAVLFVLTGASLRLEALGPAAAVVGLYVLARLAAKTLVIGALSRLSGLSLRQGALLGLSQLPMAGAAIVLVESTTSFYPEFGAGLAGVVLAAIALLEILGPIATQLAFRLAGEAGGAVRQ
jgi:Kef-type K+ transport system membrane component KefB